eukprot:g14524.t1
MVLLLRLLPLVVAWACVRETRASSASNQASDGAISFSPRTSKVYDTKPKLKIKGAEFGQLSTQDLQSLEFDPPMTASGDKQFEPSVQSDDTILLELAPGKRWPSSNGEIRLVGASHDGEALLKDGPIPVATIIPTPTVHPSTNLLYLTKSPRVMVNGTNFDEKSTSLFFNPPLVDGTDINTFVKSSNTIWVTLVQKTEGTKWADEPGPLKLVAIDTGGGKYLLREDLGGVTIAEMQADMKGHSVLVENHEEVNMYQSTKVITIAGSGFNPDGTKFRFGNTLVEGANYTASVTPESATFTLEEGSKWRLNSAALPAPLVLLAADAGDGYVPLGATNAKAGRKVATIFEDPQLDESHKEIGRTLTHEMYLTGSGFTKVFPPILVFEPHIEKEDVSVQVMNRTSIKVSLVGKKGWMPEGEAGELSVRVINTGGGMFQFEKPVPVAVVQADDAPHETGIRVFPDNAVKLYQSSDKALTIEGEGFPLDKEPKLVFGYGGPAEESFTCKTVSETAVEVSVVAGHKWSTVAGPLSLLKISFGEDEVDYSSPGLKLATILDDPFVMASQLQVYASHTKSITIQGSGFLSAFNHHDKPKVVLSPTNQAHYLVKDGEWTDSTITFSLSKDAGAKWADVLTGTVNMKVVSVDTGGGPVSMPGGGIVIAQVRVDDETFICEDSCIYANDGECDENQTGIDGLGWSHYVAASNGKESYAMSPGVPTSLSSASRGGYLGYSSMLSASDDKMAGAPSCPMGTDCTDCGLQMVEEGKCNNECMFARDGTCDDRRAMGACPDGTDCQDCGPWGQSNFTSVDGAYASLQEDSTFDQDDVGFLADENHPLLVGQEANAMGRYKRVFIQHTKAIRKENDKAEGLFMESLWAAIVIVGVSVTTFMVILLVRCVRGEKIDLPIPTNPDVDRSRR